ncbi:MAG: hypothetical protein Kow0058_19490 [Roseovarius sp.]
MWKPLSILAAAALAAPLAPAAWAQTDSGEVAEVIVKVMTPDGPKWFRLGKGVEAVDVTEGKVIRFNYQGDSIEAIEVLPDGTPVEQPQN